MAIAKDRRGMMRKQKDSAPPVNTLEIGTLYEQELQVLHGEIERQAAVSSFYKLQPSNRTSVEQFISELKQHKAIWNEVCQMGIIDFSHAILGHRKRDTKPFLERKAPGKRTRLNDAQKDSLKQTIVRILAHHKQGLNRNNIAHQVSAEEITELQIDHFELPNKLRQPIAELLASGNIYSEGTKRLLKYYLRSHRVSK